MHKNKIAFVADTQLYMRLYGQEETRLDWYKAFAKAFDIITQHRDEVAAVVLLGDIMDANEVGSSAAYTLQSVLQKFSETKIPVGMILGNHDNERNSKHTWVEVCQLVNPYLVRLTRTPMVVNTPTKDIFLYGIDNGSRERIAVDLASLTQQSNNIQNRPTEHWLCLHQALKELAPHKFAWDMTSDQVPQWINRVFLGDFHNTAQYTDMTGREFIYPGATETVSFNQVETPGFILFDTETNTYTHYSSQQREYITFDAEGLKSGEILSQLSEAINASIAKFHEKPVVKVLYTAANYTEYLSIEGQIKPLVLQLFAAEKGRICVDNTVHIYEGNVSETGLIQSKEAVMDILPGLMRDMGLSASECEDIGRILSSDNALSEIHDKKFSGAVYKKYNLT